MREVPDTGDRETDPGSDAREPEQMQGVVKNKPHRCESEIPPRHEPREEPRQCKSPGNAPDGEPGGGTPRSGRLATLGDGVPASEIPHTTAPLGEIRYVQE